jgi:hypothetical protein
MLVLVFVALVGLDMREPGFIKRAPRVDTRFDASLVDSDGGKIPVIVTDISREGCRIETDGSLTIGEKVQLEVPKYGSFPAQIRWAAGSEAGAVFLEPVFLP